MPGLPQQEGARRTLAIVVGLIVGGGGGVLASAVFGAGSLGAVIGVVVAFVVAWLLVAGLRPKRQSGE